jgi:hypothetical protein
MKKTAIIITLVLVAIITAAALWIFRPANPLADYIKRAPILLPPPDNWPPDVIAAFTQFKELKGKWRGDQEHAIVLFFMRYEHMQNSGAEDHNYAPLAKSDVLALLGPPDVESKHRYAYQTVRTEWNAQYLDIFFNRGKACFVGSGSGQCSRLATPEELMKPPDEKESEPGAAPSGDR